MPRGASVLDGFFRPARPLDVLAAARAIAELSHGEVKSGQFLVTRTGSPQSGGLLCERIFGPIKDHECRCGFLGGPRGRPPAGGGERCPKCGVEAISARARDERFGHADMHVPLVHPALQPVVAEALGWSEDDVRDVVLLKAWIDDDGCARREGDVLDNLDRKGAPALRELLASRASGPTVDALRAEGFRPEDLLIERVPVVPPGDRPLVTMPGGRAMPGHDNLAYALLIERRNTLAWRNELSAPGIVIAMEALALQVRFTELCAQMSGAPDAVTWNVYGEDEHKEVQEGSGAEARREGLVSLPCETTDGSFRRPLDPTRPIAGALLTDGSVLLQYAYVILHLAKSGRILRAIPAVGQKILATSADGRYVLTQRSELHLYDLREGRWSTQPPDDLPLVYMEETQEQAFLIDARRGGERYLHEVCDYPALYVTSPDGRFVWVEDKERSGGVFAADTKLCVLMPSELGTLKCPPPVMRRDGTRMQLGDDDETDAPERPVRCAITLTPGNQFLVADCGVVALEDQTLLLLEPPWPVVAFSREGEALLVFRRDAAIVTPTSNGFRWTIAKPDTRYDVSALRADLTLEALGKMRRATREALLARFGGAWGIAEAPVEAIAAVPGVSRERARAIARTLQLKSRRPIERVPTRRARL